MAKALASLRSTFGIADSTAPTTSSGFWESLEDNTTLSRTNRFYGFGASLGLGILFCSIAMVFVVISPTKFAVFYTLGLLCLIASTFFLMGPWNQLKNVMKQHRLPATITFFVLMCLTLWAAFSIGSTILTIMFFILQMIALLWYVLTYIPYGQQAASSFITSMFS